MPRVKDRERLMKIYGVMLVGCGHIGMEHILDIHYRDNVRIEAVVDTDPVKAQAAARRCGAAHWDTDYRPYLDSDRVDIVIVATYTDSHLPLLRECLAAHKHVLCEKPIGLSLAEGRAFVEAVKAAPEKVLITHILRHNRSYQKIRELIQGGAIGELRLMRMTQNHHAMDWPRYCRLMEDCSPTVDCGVHYYDVAQWVTGSRITEVTGFGQKTQPDAPRENYTMVTFRMENGVAGFYEAGWGQNLRACNVKEFIGTKGRITLDMQMQRGRDGEEGDLLTVYHSDTGVYETVNVRAEYKDMYAQLETLIAMIETDAPGSPTIDEVWSAFAVAQAAGKAVAENTTVTVARE